MLVSSCSREINLYETMYTFNCSFLYPKYSILSIVLVSPYVAFAQKSEIQNEYSKSTNQMLPDDTVGNSTDLLAEMYTPDQIDEMIYRLQDDIQNNNTETRHFQAIAVLLNLICYDEYYENIIDACDIVTKIPIE